MVIIMSRAYNYILLTIHYFGFVTVLCKNTSCSYHREMINNLPKVSTCELECDGMAVDITNKAKKSLATG